MMAALAGRFSNANPPEVTGVFDAATKKAVLELQALFGHAQTGVIDRRFWAYLARLYTLLHRRRHDFCLFRCSVCTQQISAVKHSGSWAAPPTEGAREFRWDGLWPELLPVFP